MKNETLNGIKYYSTFWRNGGGRKMHRSCWYGMKRAYDIQWMR